MITIKARRKHPHTNAPAIDLQAPGRPGSVVTVTGMLMALWCLGLAVVNLALEVTGHFTGGAHAHYTSGISVMDWLVAALKVAGATVALLSVAQRPRLVSPAVVSVLVWAAFATLGVYVLGSMAEAAGMGLGLRGGVDQIDVRGVAYVLFSWSPRSATASWPPLTPGGIPTAKVSSSSVSCAPQQCSACCC